MEESEFERLLLEAGFENPSVEPTRIYETLTMLGRRIDLLCALPDEKLRGLALETCMNALATEEYEQPDGGRR